MADLIDQSAEPVLCFGQSSGFHMARIAFLIWVNKLSKLRGIRAVGTTEQLLASLDSTPVFLGPRPLVFAQFGDGDGLTSRIVLTNPDLSQAAQAVIEMRNPEGGPLVVDFEDGQITLPGSTFEGRLEVEIPAGGSAAFQTDGMGDVLVGSVTVTSSQVLSGVILFGGPTGLAGVGSSQVMLGGLSAPVLESPADGIRTGVAVVNLEDQQVTRLIQIIDADGVVLASADLTLPPGAKEPNSWTSSFPRWGASKGH